MTISKIRISSLLLLNAIDFIIYPLFMFVSAPLILKIFGETGFGFWIIILSLLALANLFNLGISNASLQFLNNKNLNQFILHKFIFSLIILSVLLTIFVVGISSFLKKDIIMNEALGIDFFAIGLIICCLAIEQFDTHNGAILKSSNRIFTNLLIDIFSKLFVYSLGLFTIYFTNQIISFIYIVLLIFILKVIIKNIIIRNYSLRSFSRIGKSIQVRKFLFLALGFFFMAFNGFALGIGERFFLSNIFLIEDVGKIALASQMIFFIHSLPAAGMSFLLPVLSSRLYKIKTLSILIINFLFSFFVLCLLNLFLNLGGLELWLGRHDETIYSVINSLMLPMFLYSLSVAPYYIIMSNKNGFMLATIMLSVSIIFLLFLFLFRNSFIDINVFLNIKSTFLIILSGVIYGFFFFEKIKQKESTAFS